MKIKRQKKKNFSEKNLRKKHNKILLNLNSTYDFNVIFLFFY